MTYYSPRRTLELPLMTPQDADRLLNLLEEIVSVLHERADEWHDEQVDLPFVAALDVALPPSAASLERDRADADGIRIPRTEV